MISVFGKTRTAIQSAFVVLTNSYFEGFINGTIYTGKLKSVCAPGLNCYSCPGALGSCPMGAVQVFTAGRGFVLPLYILGFLTMIGVLLGRFVCGFLCPFGLLQDLIYKIPFIKKIGKLPGDKYMKFFPYVILAIFVIFIPMFFIDSTGLGSPAFCKYICPSGTLGAGVPLVLTNEFISGAVGKLFFWKLTILVLIVVSSIVAYRPFCRYLCPLGAVYGLFNPISFLSFKIDRNSCNQCHECRKACKWSIDVQTEPNSRQCIRCGRCIRACKSGAVQCKFSSNQETIAQRGEQI